MPPGFRPTDATFISDTDGWAIGKAACVAGTCTTVVRTGDGGHRWAAIPAPQADLIGLRFATAKIGYAFGRGQDAAATSPSLYSTSDGGATWWSIGDRTLSITALEPGPAGVFASTGDPSRPNDLLRVTPAGVSRLPGPERLAAGTPSLVVHGSRAYVAMAPSPDARGSGALVAFDGSATQSRPLPCTTRSSTLALAASGDEDLALVCGGEPSAGNQVKQAWSSADGGRTWRRTGDPPRSGYLSSIAAVASGTFLTGGRNAVLVTRDEGRSWPVSYNGVRGDQAGDSGYLTVGFTDATHGFALPAGTSNTEIDLTSDGGHSWAPATFQR